MSDKSDREKSLEICLEVWVESCKKAEKERDELIEELEHRNYISDIKSIVNHGPVCDDLNNIEVQNGPFDGRIVWKERASR